MILVVTPNYNCGKYLKNLYNSLLHQGQGWKWVIGDDGSTDDSIEILEELVNKNSNVSYVRLAHKGANAARNAAIKWATGGWFCPNPDAVFICDADSELEPTCLSELYDAMNFMCSADLAYCAFKRIGEGYDDVFYSSKWDPHQLKIFNYISFMSLFRWSTLRKYIPLDEELPALQDWDLVLSIAENGGFGVYVPKVLFKAYCRPEGISQGQKKDPALRDQIIAKIKEKHGILN